MRAMLLTGLAVCLVAAVGCSGGTSGGPGVVTTEAKTRIQKMEDAIVQPENTFKLEVPLLTTKLKQGEAKEIAIRIARGKNFSENVDVKLDELPKGLTVEPSAPTIKSDQTETKVLFKAANDAAVGSFGVKVIGHPTEKGADSVSTVKIDVEKK